MSTTKKCQVILLPTEKKAPVVKFLDSDKLIHIGNQTFNSSISFVFCNLYILSDEEIKEGDWFYDHLYGVKQYNSKLKVLPASYSKKIIATTDSSLFGPFEEPLPKGVTNPIPKPSEDFIKVFVEEYNKDNIIKQVDVDYIHSRPGDCGCRGMVHDGCGWADDVYDLKVNSKNEITIRKIKNTWTREELHKIIASHQYDKGVIDWKNLIPALCKELEYDLPENWIEDNL